MKEEKFSIYIDGFNFYNSAIRHKSSEYYYPNLRMLCTKVLNSFRAEHNYDTPCEIHKLYFFTSEVKGTREDQDKLKRQRQYHNALKNEGVEIRLGEFRKEYKEIVDESTGRTKQVKTLREKQTDINLAVQMLNDAWSEDEYEHSVLVSDDADFTNLLEAVADRGKKVSVWYVGQKPTKDLVNKAHYTHQIKPKYIKQAGPVANPDFDGRGIDYP